MKRAFLLGLLAFLVGCGQKPPAADPSPAPAAPTPPAIREVAYELDPAKHDIPAQPVGGKLAGKAFAPDAIELDGYVFTLRQGRGYSPEAQVIVILQGEVPTDKETKIVVKPDQKTNDRIPTVSVLTKGPNGELAPKDITEGYALTLELAKPERGYAAGRIYLTLPGGSDVLAGTFNALHDRATIAAPTPDDRPYITGGLDTGGDGQIVAGYVRLPAEGLPPIYETVQTNIAGGKVGEVRSGEFKPRTATLRPNSAGTGADYDLTKLPPGKYLVAARLEGKPSAWTVQEVKADSAITAPLKMPTDAGGKIEVEVPGLGEEAMVQTQALPAEVAATDSDGSYEAHAGLVLGTWADVVKGKATIPLLAPGEYVVVTRSGGNRYSAKVTVKAGETAKAVLMPVP